MSPNWKRIVLNYAYWKKYPITEEEVQW